MSEVGGQRSEVRSWLGALVVLVALLAAAPLCAAPAKERDPAEADALYHEIGGSMICLCGGCRERLLECSMVNCSFSGTARKFLQEECKDATRSPDQIRTDMIARFGPEIMQVHGNSLLNPVLIGVGLSVAAIFGGVLWFFSTRGKQKLRDETPSKPISDPSLEARIVREMEEIE
jgi:hypothetical protein